MLKMLNIVKDANKLNTNGSLVPRTSVNSLWKSFLILRYKDAFFIYI